MNQQGILLIDGENFLHKIEEIIEQLYGTKDGVDITSIDMEALLAAPLADVEVTKKIFYIARLRQHPETIKKSQELIAKQRRLKTNLEKQGFEVIIAGNVRGQKVITGKETKIVFKEKGVDVRIAVDLVSMACDKKISLAILCSSDSDLQPAVAELKKRKVKIFYMGFELNPNKGLSSTTDRTILIRNTEVVAAFPQKKLINNN